jgi:hypothetical protein
MAREIFPPFRTWLGAEPRQAETEQLPAYYHKLPDPVRDEPL